MFGFTAKLTKKRLLCLLLAVIIPLLIFGGVKLFALSHKSYETKASTAAERIKFLSNFGWECDTSGETVKDTSIPSEFDDVYTSYNEIQKAQGFDLTPYLGKSVKIYTLKVQNYPENTEFVYATLMVFDNKIIGGDIHSTALNGFMHGFDLTDTGLTFGQKVTEKSTENQ